MLAGLSAVRCHLLAPIRGEEVLRAIDVRKNGKTPKDNGIANTALKKLPVPFQTDILVLIRSVMLDQRTFPNVWNHANALRLYKRGKDLASG